MAWLALRLVGLSRARLREASDLLFAAGSTGLQESPMPGDAPSYQQPWDTGPPAAPPDPLMLTAWFEDPNQASIDAQLARLDCQADWSPVEEVDWQAKWRASFTPVKISPRFVVAPPWDAPEGALIIEPGLGFGTGSHPTTRSALAAVDDLADGLRTALDVGCGSGILGIAAAKLGMSVQGIDIDEPAVRDAAHNAALNGVSATWSTRPIQSLDTPCDLVLANLHAELIVSMAPDLLRLTGKWLVLAGILVDREVPVRDTLGPHLRLAHRDQDGEWVGLRYRREP